MTQAEAKAQIVPLWQEWLQANRSGKQSHDMQMFHAYVEQHYPQLLKFRAAGDKWQTFKMWIQDRY
ncbi:MAG: hypothetical protein ACN6OP_12805 [Pseudomonadales bacterium]